MIKREKSAKPLFLPYKQFGIDIFKDKSKNHFSSRNAFNHTVKTALPSLRPLSQTKNESLFEVDKKLKKVTLSNRTFFNYMNKYTKLTQNFTFKIPDILNYPKKKNPKYLSIFNLQKIGYSNVSTEKSNFNDKININNTTTDNNSDYNIIDKMNFSNNEKQNESEDNYIIKKPYGFKYGDTRIVYDKSKMRVKSSLFRNNNTNFNLTKINTNQNYKNRSNYNFHISKEEKKRNKIFNYFYEGDFLQNQNQRTQSNYNVLKKKRKNNNIIINDYDVNNNFQILYDMIKQIKNIKKYPANKSMKYNIKNYYKKEDFSFQVDIDSICLKFINQDKSVNENKGINSKSDNNSQKLFIPFDYLPLFYLLDYTTFKIFLSEIIYYNKETNLMEINKSAAIHALNKYKKFITLNIINQESNKKRKMEKITYNCKEQHFQIIYDWIIYLNDDEGNINIENEENKDEEEENNEDIEKKEIKDNNNNKNIVYKLKIILPMIKFQIFNRNITIKKYLNKNLLINLLKNDFEKWEEIVLCELFMNKKFRNIMNSTIKSNRHIDSYSSMTKKIFIDKVENKENILIKSKYEFFITNTEREFSHYLYYSPYSILVLFGKEKDKKFFSNIHLNIKESINLNKYSKFWGYMNTLNKCLTIDKNNQKVYLDLKILEEDPKKFFNLKKSKNDIFKYKENIKDLDNEGFIKYKNNDDLEMNLLNCSIVEMQINQFKIIKRFYKVPKSLLDIFLSEKMKDGEHINIYINEFCEDILFNNEILNLRKEEIELRRKALNDDGTINLEEDFSSERHESIFSFKNLNKLNSFRITPNRYSTGVNFNSADSNYIKRSETINKIKFNGLGMSFKSLEHINKSQKVNRKSEKKYTVFQKKRNSKMPKNNNKDFLDRNPNKTNTNIIKVDENDKDNEKNKDQDKNN